MTQHIYKLKVKSPNKGLIKAYYACTDHLPEVSVKRLRTNKLGQQYTAEECEVIPNDGHLISCEVCGWDWMVRNGTHRHAISPKRKISPKRDDDCTILRTGLIKRIHVNQHVIKANTKYLAAGQGGFVAPPLTVQARGGPYPAHEVEIRGPSKVVYSPEKPLSCGARVWVETTAEVEIA